LATVAGDRHSFRAGYSAKGRPQLHTTQYGALHKSGKVNAPGNSARSVVNARSGLPSEKCCSAFAIGYANVYIARAAALQKIYMHCAVQGAESCMAVTIKDVAREARVSVASVSRALNGSANVTEITRRRIIGVAERLRYVPHSAARSLITRRTQTVGALLPDLFGEFFSELIRGIDLAARARGLHLLVSSSHGHSSEAAAALRAMQGRVDGVLVMSPHVDAAFLSDHLSPALPAVLINTPVHDSPYTTLNIDNYGGAFAMTQHLIGRGFGSIAFVTGPDGNFDASERLRGFNDAVARSGKSIDVKILHGDFTEESGHRIGMQLRESRARPRAVFAANDMMAIGLLLALSEGGVRVPDDVAIAGFDDIPISRFVNPPLTTVRVRIADLGRSALEQLALQLDMPEANHPAEQKPSCDIVVRGSCGGTNNHSAAGPGNVGSTMPSHS
jgi:LacI family transcriptional regulator